MTVSYPLNHKLTTETVTRIKQLLYEGATHTLLAKEFGVSQPQISRIASGASWPQVPWPDGRIGSGDETRLRRRNDPTSETNLVQSEGKAIKKLLTPQLSRPATSKRASEDETERVQASPSEDHGPVLSKNTRSGPTIPDFSWMDELEKLRDLGEVEAEREVIEGLSAVGKKGPVKPAKKPTLEDQKKISWEHITEMAPTAKMVQLAMSAEFLQPAVEVVFAKLPRQLWNSQKAEEEVAKIAKLFDLIPKEDELLKPLKELKDD